MLYVLVIVSGHDPPSETSETKATIGFTVQLSCSSVTALTSGVEAGGKAKLIGARLLAVGFVVSSIVMVWVTVETFPHTSVYVHVLVIVPPQFPPMMRPSVPVTVPVPSQLSVHAKSVIAGISPTHSIIMFAGAAANTGAVVSSIVMVWVTVEMFPHTSVCVHVLVIVPPQFPPMMRPSVPVTVPVPSQLSVHAKSVITGMSPTHSTVVLKGGAEKNGGIVSSIVKV